VCYIPPAGLVTEIRGLRTFSQNFFLEKKNSVSGTSPQLASFTSLKSRPTITRGIMSIVSQGASGSAAHIESKPVLDHGGERKLPSDLDCTITTFSPPLPAVASHTVQANPRDMIYVYLLFPRGPFAAMVHVNSSD